MNSEQSQYKSYLAEISSKPSNRIFIKAIITALLILGMLIPTMFVSSTIYERQNRREQVVADIASKWAGKQTTNMPYMFIPSLDSNTKPLFILPDNVVVKGNVQPEERTRSIYKVLLYRSQLTIDGNYAFSLPAATDISKFNLQNAKVCFGITDIKGIENNAVITLNNTPYELLPGLPSIDIDKEGLSAQVNLSTIDITQPIHFSLPVKIKGSEQLQFIPLAGNSSFELSSTWSNPSFAGNALPTTKETSNKGFTAKWSFGKTNFPFRTVLQDANISTGDWSFGVNLIQPADQYAKTERSVKYAILFIGLTFALFFIMELLQKKPVHPVQYILVGVALVIFYTLLLSISEFILFDYAYLIAASAIVMLITLYVKAHFRSWKTTGIFAAVLSGLYGFIFVLIRLEDTALLVGSIGLFAVLALVMYASRKINWYGNHSTLPPIVQP